MTSMNSSGVQSSLNKTSALKISTEMVKFNNCFQTLACNNRFLFVFQCILQNGPYGNG